MITKTKTSNMKKAIVALFMTLQALTLPAQELTVTYQATYNTASPQLFAEAGLPEAMRSSLAAAYKDVVMTFRLVIKGDESEYRVIPSKEKQEITFMGKTIDVGAAMQAQAQNYTYKNHAEGIVLDKTQVFGKDFIVSDSLQGTPFTPVEGEKKDILGFECLKAVSPDGKTTVWYTPHIPVKDEPIACGLNGLILQFDTGQQIFTAMEIADSASTPIVRPTGEKIMPRGEFADYMKKRVEMMKRN